MRRFGTLLTALLLATAAAAGAGDNIKWERSEDLTFVPPTMSPSEVPGSYEDIRDNRTLTWKRSFGNYYVEGITATYVDSAFYCKARKSDAPQIPESFCWKSITHEDPCELFEDALLFYVNLNAWEDYCDLEDAEKWEVFLLKGEEKYGPLVIIRDPATDKPRLKKTSHRALDTHGMWPGATIEYDHSVSFSVVFENPYKGKPYESVKLVLACDECRRGFEWRFKE